MVKENKKIITFSLAFLILVIARVNNQLDTVISIAGEIV